MRYPSLLHRLRALPRALLVAGIGTLPPLFTFAAEGDNGKAGCLTLLVPLPNGKQELCTSADDPFKFINDYLRPMLSYMIGIAAGIALLMVIIGGMQIILSGGDQGKIGEGKKRVTEAILGLLLLVFSGTILYFLNAYFFELR